MSHSLTRFAIFLTELTSHHLHTHTHRKCACNHIVQHLLRKPRNKWNAPKNLKKLQTLTHETWLLVRLSKTHTFIRFFKCYELFALGKLSMSLKLSSRHTRAYSRTFAFRNTQSVPLSAISNSNENVRLRACGRATTEERERETKWGNK